MNDANAITSKLEEVEARCEYLGVVLSAMLRAMPNRDAFLESLEIERKMNDANSLYSASLSDRQQQLIQNALDALSSALR